MEKEPWRRSHGVGAMEKEPWRRSHGEGTKVKEPSEWAWERKQYKEPE